MNYLLVVLGGGIQSNTVLGYYHIEPWERPTKGQEITISGRLWKVAYTDPDSPTDTQTATIYLESPNPNWPYKK